jgi:hypothetical protein
MSLPWTMLLRRFEDTVLICGTESEEILGAICGTESEEILGVRASYGSEASLT